MSDCCWAALAKPGEKTYGSLDFEGHRIPVAVATGRRKGPVLLVIGMQHAREFSGPAALDRLFATLDPARLAGTLAGLPFVNPLHLRETGDRPGALHRNPETNLNRQWINRADAGNPLARLAALVWDAAIRHADALLDMHCCRDIDPRFGACLDGHGPSEALSEAIGLDAVDRQTAGSYDSRQLMLAAAAELDIPAVLVESRPGGYQTPEAVEACSMGILRAMRYLGMLAEDPTPTPGWSPTVFRRADRGYAIKASCAGYLGIRHYPGAPIAEGEPIVDVRSVETFEVLESLASPITGGVSSVAETDERPFVSEGGVAASVKPLAAPALAGRAG